MVRPTETLEPILTPSPERAAEWQELVSELRRLLNTEWPALRDSLAINQTRAFARELEELGDAAQCDPLIIYAAKLARLSGAYAVKGLERHLAEFPKVVELIEVSSAQPVHA
jgi:hypothetical protein